MGNQRRLVLSVYTGNARDASFRECARRGDKERDIFENRGRAEEETNPHKPRDIICWIAKETMPKSDPKVRILYGKLVVRVDGNDRDQETLVHISC
jgi:hypothetical protein